MKLLKYAIMMVLCLCGSALWAQERISLAGAWTVKLDSADVGIREAWFNQHFNTPVSLPGTLDDAGIGEPTKLSADQLSKEILLSLTRKHRYVGPAWYAKEVVIPATWKNKDIQLFLERVIWNTQVWVDGKPVAGFGESLSVPHRFDLSTLLTPGKHRLVIRIDNRKQYDISHKDMAHAYTDGTQIIWNGIIGQLALIAQDKLHIAQIQTYPKVDDRSVRIRTHVQNKGPRALQATLLVQVLGKDGQVVASTEIKGRFVPGNTEKEVTLALGKNALLWDEFQQSLYTVKAKLKGTGSIINEQTTTFGLRKLTALNSALQVNGRRIFLRGTLECNIFPLTGHPPMDKAGWLKVFNTAKAYGLNHLRFHSWCPPEAAFDVADSLGFYLQIELPLWSLVVGEDEGTNHFLEQEALRISEAYGNHPSFCLWSLGNELQGDFNWLSRLLQRLKVKDPRHLYATTTFTFQKGHGTWPEAGDDYFVTQYTKKGWVRGQGIFNTYPPNFSTDYTKAIDSLPVPLITHEIGQYSVYPNLEEIKKYTGVLDPLNFKAIRNDLKRKGMFDLAPKFTLASGKFAANLYKEEIERALKTKGMSGFQLLDLHDFPGQGTALVGVLDAFWDSKGLVSADEHRQYTSAVVPLLRFAKPVYTYDERFEAEAELANFSNDLKQIKPIWTVKNRQGKTLFTGTLPSQRIAVGNGFSLGKIAFDLHSIQSAQMLTIELALEGTPYKNHWNIWVYPKNVDLNTPDVVFTTSVKEALDYLDQGRNVLLNPDTAHIKGVEGRFAPVFWSPVHFPDQPGTMGILCNPDQAALAHFPTAFYSDWQWWDIIHSSKTMVIDGLPAMEPIVRVIDNFFKNRQMANIIEAKVGKGKLIVASMNLTDHLDQRPAARQLRYSLQQYMASKAFSPSVTLNAAQLNTLVKE